MNHAKSALRPHLTYHLGVAAAQRLQLREQRTWRFVSFASTCIQLLLPPRCNAVRHAVLNVTRELLARCALKHAQPFSFSDEHGLTRCQVAGGPESASLFERDAAVRASAHAVTGVT